MNRDELLRLAREEGFSAAAFVPVDEIVFDARFRPYCEENLCGQYGANYSCPPDCGTPEEMEARMRQYGTAMVFQTKWDITDYTDMPAIRHAKRSHNNAMLRVIQQLGKPGAMAGASCCSLCDRCARKDDAPCPHPDICFSCMSAYCIYVKKLADACGMEYTCSDGKLALFGLYAF